MRISSAVATALGIFLPCHANNNPHPELGGYQPVSDVIEESQVVDDARDVLIALNVFDWSSAKSIYINGKYSCKSHSTLRSLQSLVDRASVTLQLNGKEFYDSFFAIQQEGGFLLSKTFWDNFILEALDGTAVFEMLTPEMRTMAVSSAFVGVLTLYTASQMEKGIAQALSSSNRLDGKAPHEWDVAVAYYHGNGNYTPEGFIAECDAGFACGSENGCVDGAVAGQTMAMLFFQHGLKAIRASTYDAASLNEAREYIYRIFALSSIRAALKYAYLAQHSGDVATYRQDYHIAGYTLFLVAAGWIERKALGVGTDVLALLDFRKTTVSPRLYCDVKTKLIPAFERLGLSCEMVGHFKEVPSDDLNCENVPACPSGVTLFPTPMGSYRPGYSEKSAGKNVDCSSSVIAVSEAHSLWTLPVYASLTAVYFLN